MRTIDPKDTSTRDLYGLLTGSVIPRPIAFVSTIDKDGQVNLSPYSFFNAVSADPPIVIFSCSRRVRDNTTKHTLQNVLEVPEAVISIVNYPMVEQMSLSSTDYPKGTNEYIKAGFTQVTSTKVGPPRVGESPISFECKVRDVIHLGDTGGAGSMVVCEIVLAHFDDNIFDDSGRIDPVLLNPVARLGGNNYSRVTEESLFEVNKPISRMGIGIDQLPQQIKSSHVLTGNNLGRLGTVESLPSKEEITEFVATLESKIGVTLPSDSTALHQLAKTYIEGNKIEEAFKILLSVSV